LSITGRQRKGEPRGDRETGLQFPFKPAPQQAKWGSQIGGRMQMGRATRMTSKGQVTIPKEIRDEFGLKPHDKIEFYVESGELKVRRARFTLDEMEGMLPPIGIPVEEMPDVAWQDWVEEYVKDRE